MLVSVCLTLQGEYQVLVELVNGNPFPLLPVGTIEIAIPPYFRGKHVMLHHASITKTGRSICSVSSEVYGLLQAGPQTFELAQEQLLPGSFSTHSLGQCGL